MNFPKLMVSFHLLFLLLGGISLFLMASNMISFDATAYWAIMIAIFLNAFFGILWFRQVNEEKVEKPQLAEEKVEKPQLAGKAVPDYSMVSLVVPVYNQEKNVMHCLNNLYECASKRLGPTEIIIVDDGSTDNTSEVTWATISSKKEGPRQTRIKLVRHMSHLGRTEAVRTGVNRAMGEYIGIVDVDTFCKSVEPAGRSNFLSPSEGEGARRYAHPSANTITRKPNVVQLYPALALRPLMNEKEVKPITEHFEFVC
jgi:cellulose synthase/poly-beta-1,6-N-acetylglucosamine synthase-like glycosyltransferase